MVTTVTSYTDSRNRAYAGEGYDGVVRVSVDGYYGTGTLLFDGKAVLTAAHLFAGSTGELPSIIFETTAGLQELSSGKIKLHAEYDAANTNNDLALVWLSVDAPVTAERYGLYRNNDEIGQGFTFTGYGLPGTGSSGYLDSYTGSPLRQKAGNEFDADTGTLKNSLGSGMDWTPLPGSQLAADFDNGSALRDALGRLIGSTGLGLGLDEGMISPGDSGGPAFVDGLLAGVASYSASLSQGSVVPDNDVDTNSSYGEVGAWMRASYYQQWIDQNMRANYSDAPTKPGDVQKAVTEGNSGTAVAYFLLQFTGVRTDPNQWLSVDYTTRDGTASAGTDYLAANGTLILYPDENQAVIPVEVIGDTTPEPDELFYLDASNPVGGSFGEGIVQLTAVRTIVDDDGWLVQLA